MGIHASSGSVHIGPNPSHLPVKQQSVVILIKDITWCSQKGRERSSKEKCLLPTDLRPGIATHTSNGNRPVRLGFWPHLPIGKQPRKGQVTHLVKWTKDSLRIVREGHQLCVGLWLRRVKADPSEVSTISSQSGAVNAGVPEASGTRLELQAEEP